MNLGKYQITRLQIASLLTTVMVGWVLLISPGGTLIALGVGDAGIFYILAVTGLLVIISILIRRDIPWFWLACILIGYWLLVDRGVRFIALSQIGLDAM